VIGDHDADARGDVQLDLSRDRRGADRLPHPLRDLLRHPWVVRPPADDRELVTADPREDVGLAHSAGQPVDHPAQHVVAGVVSQAVVDDLERVEVGEDHGRRRPVGRVELLLEARQIDLLLDQARSRVTASNPRKPINRVA